MINQDLPSTDTDLAHDVIKHLLTIDYLNTSLGTFPEHLDSLLFKLVPVLAHYKRLDLGRIAIDLLISPNMYKYHNAMK